MYMAKWLFIGLIGGLIGLFCEPLGLTFPQLAAVYAGWGFLGTIALNILFPEDSP